MTKRPVLLLATTALCSFVAVAAQADPRAQVRGEMDNALRAQIVKAVGETDDAPANRFEARRRSRAAAESAEALLRSEGYYQPTIDSDVEGEYSPIAFITVLPGRRFVIAAPAIDYAIPAPDAETVAAVVETLDLEPGEPGRAVSVIAAEGRVVAGLTRRGYADAATRPRRVVVDHAAFTVQPTFAIVSGKLVRLDGIVLETGGRTNPEWVAGLAPWEAGDVYDPEDVAELERRLLETGVYDGVGVALSPVDQTLADGNRPIIVTLADRPRRILEAGVTASTAQGGRVPGAMLTTAGGSGVDAIWTMYNRFGRADTLRYEARLTDINSRLGVDLSLPHWHRPGQTLALSTSVVNEITDAYDRLALTAAADLRQRLGRASYYSYGLGIDVGQYDERRFDPITQDPVSLTRNLAIVTGRGSAYIDRSNDPLNATSGYRITANLQPTAVTGDDSLIFLRAEAQATAYLPVQDNAKTVLAGRIKLGSIIGGEELTVPSDRLFYSGGGGSVRGFEYQGVGPRLPDNTPRGGLSLFEVSAEVRRDIGQSFQAVAFVDAGAVGFEETPDFSNMRYAVGVGARYKLPFGPVRFDVAIPLEKREGDAGFQIYISLGQAF